MSALEQIRKRPALIISILGLALLLFILTAISNPERLFSDPSTIAKIDGEKIDYMQFQERHRNIADADEQRTRANGQERTNGAILEMQAMESIISEVLTAKKMQALGITVTDAEISKIINSPQPHPVVAQYLQGLGFASATDFYNFAFEPENNGIDAASANMLAGYWMQMEESLRQQLLNDKYQQIFGYALVPNLVEARQYFDESQTVDSIRYVRLSPSMITDAEAALNDDDIAAVYNEQKNRFAIDEDQNLINYIKVNITPSEADRAKAIEEVDEALEGLRTMPGTEGIYNNMKFIVENYNTSAANLPVAIATRLDQLKEDSVMQISFYDNKFTLAKYLGSGKATDKVTIDGYAVIDPVIADSVATLLNNGMPADSLGSLIAQAMNQQEISLLDPALSTDASIFDQAAVGKYFAPTREQGFPGNVVYRVVSKEAPVDVYEVAEITYHLEPSSTTISDLRDNLSDYIYKHYDAKSFVDSAATAGYTAIPAHVSKSSLIIDRIPETRTLAKWGANASNKGKVSEITSDAGQTYFLVAAVSDTYTDGFLPATDPFVKQQLTPVALTKKKVNMLAERYADKGATLEAFAEATNQPIEEAAISFSGLSNNILSADGTLLGTVAATPVGTYVAPTATDLAVIAFEKTGTKAPAREFIEELDMQEFTRHMGHPFMSPYNSEGILRHGKKIDNRIQKFMND